MKTGGIFDKWSELKDVWSAVAARQTGRDRQTDRWSRHKDHSALLSVPIKSIPLINLIGTKLQYKFIRKKKKISQFTQYFNVQMLQKIICNPGNKNTIKKLVNSFFKGNFCTEASSERGRWWSCQRRVWEKAATAQCGHGHEMCRGSETHLCVTGEWAARSCKIWSVTLIEGVVRGAEVCLLQQQG